MNIGCVIMAAGRGQRFGANKLLAPLAGAPLLSYALRALPYERLARTVAVVSDEGVAALCEACGVFPLRYPGGPQSETVRRGIGLMQGMEGCLFVQGDQPLLTPQSVERLLDSFAAFPDEVHRLSYEGVAGSPVIFPPALFPALAALSGERGGMAAARSAGARVRLVEALSGVEMMDADTEKALSEIEKIFILKNP